MELSQQALEARRAYKRKWYAENKKHVSQYNKQWRENNPEKVEASINKYWEKKGQELNEA